MTANRPPLMARTCRECGREFDLAKPADWAEWWAGHDCEPKANR